ELAPVQNLTGSAAGQKVTLKWDAPNGTNPNPNPDPNPEPGLTESFDGGIPATWTLIDADGDGHGWKHGKAPGVAGYNSNGCVYSESFGLGGIGVLTPDNYLITPALNLPNGGKLTFWVCAQDAAYASEHYAVYASSTGNAASNFTNALLEETLTAKGVRSPEAIRGRVQGTWYQKTVDLPAGTKYVAFRHFQSTDMFYIDIDEVEIKANAKRAELLNEDFEEGSIPAGWTVLDADSDGNNWGVELNQFTGRDREALAPLRASNVAISYSSLPQPGGGYVALTPDNYLITPKVEGAQKISYKVGSKGNQDWSHDHYALCISKTGTAASDFEIIFEETMVYSQGGANFTREKDLPDGTKYVAFRHYNCTDVLA
ncbi:choice-of-anchor J domain-containing protein, partial [Porphyromonas gulae]